MMRIVTIVGARPQFVKAVPVSREIERYPDLSEVLLHTGQHFDVAMSEEQFAALGLRWPDVNLGIHGGSMNDALGRMLQAIDEALAELAPAAIIVYGDTTSTLAGALAAANRGVPVVHIEAGLRSFDRRMPEERNRVAVDHLSRLLLAPTAAAVANLQCEGITDGVHHVGDVMLDTFLATQPGTDRASELLRGMGLETGDFVLATLHRADATESAEALAERLNFLVEVAEGRPILLPLHPRTQEAAHRFQVSLDGISTTEPVDYLTFSGLLSRCALVATDSGGVQKEAYFHRVPCITLRSTTEWPETVAAGWNRLWSEQGWREPRRDIDEYGAGRAAALIVEIVRQELLGTG